VCRAREIGMTDDRWEGILATTPQHAKHRSGWFADRCRLGGSSR